MQQAGFRYGLYMALSIALLLVSSCRSWKDGAAPRGPRIELEDEDHLMAQKIFPFFSLINEYHTGATTLLSDTGITTINKTIINRYLLALDECMDGGCLAEKLKFSQSELHALRTIISQFEQPVKLSAADANRYPYFIGNTGQDNMLRLMEESIVATNYIIETYLAGKTPRYAAIDAATFKPGDEAYIKQLKTFIRKNLRNLQRDALFFELPLKTAIYILQINDRDEAVRYEPLTGQVNKGVANRVKKTSWKNYRYAAMLVPGLGPGKAGVALDAGGARRCDLAAQLFKQGEAPFIVVSGGHVHPAKTPFSEAVEMKKYLLDKHNIPDDAVIVEPHARHTTTNIRNAARLVFTFGLPADKPVLFVSDLAQSTYVFMIKSRFHAELGYLPYRSLGRSISGSPVFYADSSCFRRNPLDPLDP